MGEEVQTAVLTVPASPNLQHEANTQRAQTNLPPTRSDVYS